MAVPFQPSPAAGCSTAKHRETLLQSVCSCTFLPTTYLTMHTEVQYCAMDTSGIMHGWKHTGASCSHLAGCVCSSCLLLIRQLLYQLLHSGHRLWIKVPRCCWVNGHTHLACLGVHTERRLQTAHKSAPLSTHPAIVRRDV
jgi:hypothetical protein